MGVTITGQDVAAQALVDRFDWLALFDGDPQAGGTEITGFGYARVQLAFSVSGGQASSTTTPVTFPIAAGQDVSHWALLDAATGGVIGASDPFSGVETYVQNGTFDVNSVVVDPRATT